MSSSIMVNKTGNIFDSKGPMYKARKKGNSKHVL